MHLLILQSYLVKDNYINYLNYIIKELYLEDLPNPQEEFLLVRVQLLQSSANH